MVDFRKRLAKPAPGKTLDPIEVYETLDRASDKGPLRPAQSAILEAWHKESRDKRDVILKLHTGQGKTLIGLLMLKSKLNEYGGPVVYFCPNTYLVQQTCSQAKQFGFGYCTAEADLPPEFRDGKSILITSIQKLFNGLTKFKIGLHSMPVSSILMDDCHACIDAIRDSFSIKLARGSSAYDRIVSLFSDSLENQGVGTYADIQSGNTDAFLPVPYWDWEDRHSEVVGILSKHRTDGAIKFAWPVIKDMIKGCQCVVAGGALEIVPYLPPLDLFGSYFKAKHRFLMSATVTDDSFLVRGLRISPDTIRNPLVYKEERWSGEKMILLPSLMDESIGRSEVVKQYAPRKPERRFGVVTLASSFKSTQDWQAYGATVATKETINSEIEKLKSEKYESTLVIVNRYDGIDLPDGMCRVLVFDSKPHFESLIDRYAEGCRATSEMTVMRTIRIIEQGLGRSVRGEKDYCVIILTGSELIKIIRSMDSRIYLSNQTRAQIEIGLEIAEMAKEEIEKGGKPREALENLVNQCLKRDQDWKAFYTEKMAGVVPKAPGGKLLDVLKLELNAETLLSQNEPNEAINVTQRIIDEYVQDDGEKGWYLQEMARYAYRVSKTESNKHQLEAHRKNQFLMKPRIGMKVEQLTIVSQKRIEKIISWVQSFGNYEMLNIVLEDVLGRLTFGVKADRFEQAFDELGRGLGFACQRPEKQWKEGPDNLWGIRAGEFLLVECKSEVQLNRAEIYKGETGQVNNSCAWFAKNYGGAKATRIIIIPPYKLAKGAGFNEEVRVMGKKELTCLTNNVQDFFAEFKLLDFQSLSETKVQTLIESHSLSADAVLGQYSKKVRP